MTNLAMKMAMEFKSAKEMELEKGDAGDFTSAEYYMNKKWSISKDAEQAGISEEFSKALRDLGVY